jgi:hypothetical protein
MLYMDSATGAKHTGANKMNAQDKECNAAYEQAQAQANSICNMVAALEVDYERLEELRDDIASYEDDENTGQEEQNALAEWREELRALEAAANGNEHHDQALEAIHNDALDVQVRSDWHQPNGDNTPSEFMILLCTGGPAVRIMGELDGYLQPKRAWLEYQDWGTPWMEAPGIIDQDTLLTYCQQFWFGE